MIYLKKEDWSNLILSKLTNEESFKEEFKELWRIYNIINLLSRKIYQQINEQQIIFIAAQIIFHKFRICSNFAINKYSSEELFILLGTCLYIGQRALNILKIKLDNISSFLKQLITKKNPTINYEINDLNKKIIQKEYDILTTIGFNIEIDSPYLFFYKLKKFLTKSDLNSANFNTLLNYIITDSYILPLSLYYTPNIIVISCVKILTEKFNLQFINIKELISLSEYKLEEEDILQCTSLIQKIEDEINNKKNQKNNNNKEIKKETEEKGNKNPVSPGASITNVIPSIKMNTD